MDIKYPHIKVRLVGEDGNAFAIMGRAGQALQKGGIGKIERDLFFKECMSSDYDNLLQTCMRWVTTDPFMEVLCGTDPDR
jgi:hypothetical protein